MASIWKEEVAKGLIDEIYNSVKVRDVNGVLVPLSDKRKQIVVRKPEEDFKPEKFPCVSIYNTTDKFSPIRHNPNKEKKKLPNGVFVLQDRAVPFDLMFNIDFWSKYQSDMDDMTREWLFNHFRQFNLLVQDDKGEDVYVNCLQKTSPTKSDLVSGGERLFHTIISYCIWVEIKSETQYNTDVATKVNINISQKQ